MGEYEDMASFASMFSNSNAGGKMPKKKSASARQKAKAKGLKNAAYVALGKPAGKKTKNSGGKSSAGKGSGSKGSGYKGSGSSSSSSKSKPMTNTGGSPYVTSAVTKATAMNSAAKTKAMTAAMNSSPYTTSASISATNKKFTSPYVSAGSRSAKPAAKPMSAADMKSSAAMALGNPKTKQVRAKSTKTTAPVKATKGSQSRPATSRRTA
jgi:hypothetical protein